MDIVARVLAEYGNSPSRLARAAYPYDAMQQNLCMQRWARWRRNPYVVVLRNLDKDLSALGFKLCIKVSRSQDETQ